MMACLTIEVATCQGSTRMTSMPKAATARGSLMVDTVGLIGSSELAASIDIANVFRGPARDHNGPSLYLSQGQRRTGRN